MVGKMRRCIIGVGLYHNKSCLFIGVPSAAPFTNKGSATESVSGILKEPRNFDESDESEDEEWHPNVQFARGTKKR